MTHLDELRAGTRSIAALLAKGKRRAHMPGYHLAVTGHASGHLRHDWVPDTAPTALALFAGAGGASIGLHNAGARVVGAYDFDHDAIAAHRALMPDHPAEVADLSTLPSLPPADLWWASPPCQPFSDGGKGLGSQDDRNGYPHLLRLLRSSPAPKWLVIENVPGVTRHSTTAGCSPTNPKPNECRGCYLASVEAELRHHFPHVESRVLDSADYGVPQHRKRHITVCGPDPIQWPDATHGPEGEQPWVSAGEALGLTEGTHLSVGGPGANHGRGPSVVGLDRPSPTVRTHADLYLVNGDERVRTLRVPERARLMGLPPHPVLTGKQVGNAVPPPLAEAVVRAVLDGDET